MTTLSYLVSKLQERGITTQLSALKVVTASNISTDSRLITPGSIYAAIKGRSVDGLSFAPDAVRNGAVAILTDRAPPKIFSSPIMLVDDLPGAIAEISAQLFGSEPEKKIGVAVTGTNGKTSVAYLLAQALSLNYGTASYSGTLGSAHLYAGKEKEFLDSATTTPISVDFHRFLGAEKKSRGFAVELSSMALDQRRLEGLELDVAIFTNLTRDHLDYHLTSENYLRAKELLFVRDLPKSKKQLKFAVLNRCDPSFESLCNAVKDAVLTYSVDAANRADLNLLDSRLSVDKSWLSCGGKWGDLTAEVQLVGRYNLENLLAVITTLLALSISPAKVMEILPKLRPVPGRLEKVRVCPDKPTVLVDYAHTPDALEKAIKSVRELTSGRVITVFGCGGDRDKGKRPQMGALASDLSDQVVVTSDNPRSEDPAAIIADIMGGARNLDIVKTIIDRREGISQAIAGASGNDVVLIAGKGHEPYQEVQGVKYPFSDIQVAGELLR